jgi:iron complex transport system substrate-binding protein
VKSAHVAWEWVLSEDPEVIIRTMSSEGALGWESGPSQDTLLLEKTVREILERPGAKSISAARSGQVFVVYSDLLYGMESVAGLAYLAKIMHPEADLDPEGIYKEYFERLGLDFPAERILVYQED